MHALKIVKILFQTKISLSSTDNIGFREILALCTQNFKLSGNRILNCLSISKTNILLIYYE